MSYCLELKAKGYYNKVQTAGFPRDITFKFRLRKVLSEVCCFEYQKNSNYHLSNSKL